MHQKPLRGLSVAIAILIAWAALMAAGIGIIEMAKNAGEDDTPSTPAIY